MPTPAFTALLLLTGASASAQSTVTIDVGRGPVVLHVPSSYDGSAPAPLLLTLHGYGATGAIQEGYWQFLPEAEARGFLYMFPDGMVDPGGSQYWNATPACCDLFGTNVDDSGYLRALIEEVKSQFAVDSRRVYIAGHSNGGFMAYRMACEHSDVLAAVISLAGATFFDPNDCTPANPVHTLQIHGTADNTILFNGGTNLPAPYPGAVGSAERWATYDGCSLLQDTSANNLDLAGNLAGAESTVTRWIDMCDDGGDAELWTIQGAGHVPTLSGSFTSHVFDYLESHIKPGLGSNYCSSTPNSSGVAAMVRASGSTSVTANDLVLTTSEVPAGTVGLYFVGGATSATPLGNGLRCIVAGTNGLFRLPVRAANPLGEIVEPLDISATGGQVTAGTTWNFQCVFRDNAAGGALFDTSDAISLTFVP